uniref:DNA repair protein RAD5A-like n=1 Tax=Dermatophagoides pteronyssinus TaxID=6956 RepID=A0A6P6Y567_DERPT
GILADEMGLGKTVQLLSVIFTSSTQGDQVLQKIHWRRIIFDEAHEVKNAATRKTRSVRDLVSDIRWFVSGTPLQNNLKEFLNTADESLVLLCTYTAAAVGITLTAANHVVLADPWWNPFLEDQAIDRVHRIGQTREVHVKKRPSTSSLKHSTSFWSAS